MKSVGSYACSRRFVATTLLLLIGLVAAVPVAADVVTLHDGRRFEGEIVQKSGAAVVIDTMVAGIRVRELTLERDEIKTIDEEPVPDGFYDPTPVRARASSPKRFDPDATLYLEVPLVGRIGTEVREEGLRRVLLYAQRQDIDHIVLHLDTAGGDIVEAIRIRQLLADHDASFEYHAAVKRCQGDAVVIAVICDTFTALTGAVIGGADDDLQASEDWGVEDEQVLRSQLADEAGDYLEIRGRARGARLVRAMLDPSRSLAAWRVDGGDIEMGDAPPGGVKSGAVIFASEPDKTLRLESEQLRVLGVQHLDGAISDLGKLLDLKKWQAESDYGTRTMKADAQRARRAESERTRAFERNVKRNIRRRDSANKALRARKTISYRILMGARCVIHEPGSIS